MAGPLNPGDDRDAQFLAGGPGMAVRDVLLQQAEEGHSMAALSPAAPVFAQSSGRGMADQGAHVLPASKLRPNVGLQQAPSDLTAPDNRAVQCVDRNAIFHPRVSEYLTIRLEKADFITQK